MLRQPQSGSRNLTRRAPPPLGSTSPSPMPRRLAPSRTPRQSKLDTSGRKLNTSGRKLNTFPPELNTSATKLNTCSPSPRSGRPPGSPLTLVIIWCTLDPLSPTRPAVPLPTCPPLLCTPRTPSAGTPLALTLRRPAPIIPAPARRHSRAGGNPSPPRPWCPPPTPSPSRLKIRHKLSLASPPPTGAGWRETVPPFTPTPAPGPAGAAQRTPICSRTVVGEPRVLTHG